MISIRDPKREVNNPSKFVRAKKFINSPMKNTLSEGLIEETLSIVDKSAANSMLRKRWVKNFIGLKKDRISKIRFE